MDSNTISSLPNNNHSSHTNSLVSSTTNNPSDLIKTLIPEQYQVVLLSFAYGIISLLAMIGNSSIIYIVLRNRRMHSVTNYFICNLSLSDCLVACFAIPFQVDEFLYISYLFDFHLVSSCCSSKMGSTSFSLQTSSLRSNSFCRCFYLYISRCFTRSLSCYVTSIKTETINKKCIYYIRHHLVDCLGLINAKFILFQYSRHG